MNIRLALLTEVRVMESTTQASANFNMLAVGVCACLCVVVFGIHSSEPEDHGQGWEWRGRGRGLEDQPVLEKTDDFLTGSDQAWEVIGATDGGGGYGLSINMSGSSGEQTVLTLVGTCWHYQGAQAKGMERKTWIELRVISSSYLE